MTFSLLRAMLQGMVAMGAWACALFFLRFWKVSRDRLFAFFALAFTILGGHWALLALLDVTDERLYYLYAVRLLAFLIILAGIWDKNLRPTPQR